jgi:hypothetical protein
MTRMQKALDSATESKGPITNISPSKITTCLPARNHETGERAVLAAADGHPAIVTELRAVYQIPLDLGAKAAQQWLVDMATMTSSSETISEAIERLQPGWVMQHRSCVPAFRVGFELRLRQRAAGGRA